MRSVAWPAGLVSRNPDQGDSKADRGTPL